MWQRSPVSGKTNYEPLSAPASLQNQLSGFTYDVAGNMIQNGSATCTYDGENRLTATAEWTYVYDGDGVRVEKKNGSTGTLYWTGTGSAAISESDLAGVDKEEYVFFGAERIARRDVATNAVHYYFSDHLGSASIVTNASGAIEDESDYYPYGGEMVITATAPQNYKFTGKERDAESGLDDFGARFHASALGRFMTPDWDAKPVTVPYAKFGDPQTLNLYSYVENAPVNRADADGHETNLGSACDSTSCASDKELGEKAKALNTRTVSTTKILGTTTDNLGNRTTVTETTTATFSTAKNHEGEFLSATTQTAVHSGGAAGDVIAQSGQVSISQKEAVQGMGARAFTDAQQSARPSFATQFGRVTAQDARAHPYKYLFAVAEVGMIFTPIPEAFAAIAGIHEVKASLDMGLAAGDLSWELTGMVTGK